METIKLTKRQEEIIQIVKEGGPITGKEIAEKLSLTRATLRPDLSILTMAGNLDARPRVGYFLNEESDTKVKIDKFRSQLVNEFKAHPIVIEKSHSVYDAIVQLFLEDVGTLYAVNQSGHLAGVISRKDLLRAALGNKDLNDLPVSVIMTRMPNIVTITPEENLLDAAKKLMQNRIDSLPVVRATDEDPNTFEVIGRITKTTITRAYIEVLGQ
ncbi:MULTISPECIES: helix-turn-helix transcriptional regulator [unclassified Bacillus (in: firmicutes)]|uniref:helix-turn-helix transcriptional regulator n=1 Tax=unclassified Bacillus (in: firmicutes) TaxID=185979 RepID=UPI0020C8A5E9|nr:MULTISPECIES: helix-turn-helix transcriptional regulator [unclassified Bacillus (in: firmicutes)]